MFAPWAVAVAKLQRAERERQSAEYRDSLVRSLIVANTEQHAILKAYAHEIATLEDDKRQMCDAIADWPLYREMARTPDRVH